MWTLALTQDLATLWGLQEVLAGDFDPVSDASSKACVHSSKENFAAIAGEDPLDLPTRSTSLTPLQSIGGQDLEVAASANPLPVTGFWGKPILQMLMNLFKTA